MNKKKISILLVIVIALSIPAFILLLPKLHDRTLHKFAESLTTIPLPEQTHKTDQIIKVGQQIGNSDHCDYLAAVMLDTDLTKSQLEKYYIENYNHNSSVNFIWLNETNEYTADSQFDPTVIHTLRDWITNKSEGAKTDVIVYIFEVAMTSALDFRCS